MWGSGGEGGEGEGIYGFYMSELGERREGEGFMVFTCQS